MSDKNTNNKDLNPFPTSPKPIFLRIGLLFIGAILLWFLFHALDEDRQAEERQQSDAQTTVVNPKYKVPQKFGE